MFYSCCSPVDVSVTILMNLHFSTLPIIYLLYYCICCIQSVRLLRILFSKWIKNFHFCLLCPVVTVKISSCALHGLQYSCLRCTTVTKCAGSWLLIGIHCITYSPMENHGTSILLLPNQCRYTVCIWNEHSGSVSDVLGTRGLWEQGQCICAGISSTYHNQIIIIKYFLHSILTEPISDHLLCIALTSKSQNFLLFKNNILLHTVTNIFSLFCSQKLSTSKKANIASQKSSKTKKLKNKKQGKKIDLLDRKAVTYYDLQKQKAHQKEQKRLAHAEQRAGKKRKKPDDEDGLEHRIPMNTSMKTFFPL